MAPWNPQVNELFLKALEITSPNERRAFLDAVEDIDLRAKVEALLKAGDQAGSFLEAPAALSDTILQPLAESPGTVIGHYRLLQQLGEGGFGIVFLAEQQEPVRRQVALKIIKPGMDTWQVIARFEAERQALALMDHPNIARVFDAGATATARPYFVMELVKGVPITDYCDQQQLTPRERLELFTKVCQAVQHAHQKGIIHRDIKPTNVLVTQHDGKPIPKVIDFGIAKATGPQLTDRTLFTNVDQVVGTPLYMSPEQAGQGGLDIDTRSDIYSLGVLLYELLTGTTPFGKDKLKQAAFDEVRRIIREEEPPRPSNRLSELSSLHTAGNQTSLASIAAQRKTDPAKLTKLVRGELDWIVMKALEKDRNRRYETANGFAADVLRYLADEPVQACPPSTGYRLRKFTRRNKVALVTSGLVAAALVLGTVISVWQAVLANNAYDETDRALIAKDSALNQARASADDAKEQQQRAEAARTAMRTNLTDMYTTQGLIAAERGQSAQAALWFANAAELAGDKERAEINQIRAEAWRQQAPLPVAVLVLDTEWLDAMDFHPAGRYLLTHGYDPARGEGECQLWDLPDQSAVPIAGAPSKVTAAAWDSAGVRLAFGASSGEVVVSQFPGGTALQRFTLNGRVRRLVFSPDGRYLAGIDSDGARVWDCERIAFATPPLTTPVRIRTLSFHNGSRLLATASDDHLCRVFAVPGDGKVVLSPLGHFQTGFRKYGQRPIPPVFLDQGRSLVTYHNGAVSRWDSRTGGLQSRHSLGDVKVIEPSPDGMLACVGRVDSAVLLEQRTGKPVGVSMTNRRTQQFIVDAAFSPDGTLLATACGDHDARLWSVPDGKPIGEPLTHGSAVGNVAFSPDGRHLATFERGGVIRVWKLPSPFHDVQIPLNAHSFARLSLDGRHFIATGKSQRGASLMTTSVFQVATGKPVGSPLRPGGPIVDAALLPDGQMAALVSRTPDRLSLWSWADGKQLSAIDLPSDPRKLDLSPNGMQIAVLCAGGEVLLIDPQTGNRVLQWRAHRAHPADNRYVNNGALRYFGDKLATYGTSTNSARLWEPTTGKMSMELQHKDDCNDVRSSADRRWIATASSDRTACIWDAASGKRLAEIPHPDMVLQAVFSGDGTRLLTACRDGMARLWSWKENLRECSTFPHQDEVHAATFTPDDRFVITASMDGTVRLWETVTGKLLAPPNHFGRALSVSVTPDGLRAVVGGHEAALAILDLEGRLSPPQLPTQSRRLWCEIQSGQRIHSGGAVTNLASADWLRTWHALKKSPGQLTYTAGAKSSLAASRISHGWRKRGLDHATQKQWAEAITAYSHALELTPQDVLTWQYRAQAHFALKKWDEAAADYGKVTALDPSIFSAWVACAAAHSNAGNFKDAIVANSKAIELNPKFRFAWQSRGTAWMRLKEWDKAVADYSEAIKLESKDWTVWNARATCYHNFGNWEKAAADYGKVIELDMNNVSGWIGRGAALNNSGKYAEGIADNTKAIELNPTQALAWKNRGWARMRLKEWDKAVADYSEVIKLQPNDWSAWQSRGECHVRLGQWQKARQDYEKQVQLAPNAWSYHMLARFLATAGDPKQRDPLRAVELASKAVKLFPKSPLYWNTLGLTHYRAGDWKAANDALTKSMELRKGSDGFDALYLAMSHWQLGNKEEARKWYDQAVSWLEKQVAHPLESELLDLRFEAMGILGIANGLSDKRQKKK